jgi:DNA-binding NtrC family response regulator
VRELQHVIERAVILTPDPTITARDFEAAHLGLVTSNAAIGTGVRFVRAASHAEHSRSGQDAHLVKLPSLRLDEIEAVMIQRALEITGHNRTKAAALLGVTSRTLWNKLNAGSHGKLAASVKTPLPNTCASRRARNFRKTFPAGSSDP